MSHLLFRVSRRECLPCARQLCSSIRLQRIFAEPPRYSPEQGSYLQDPDYGDWDTLRSIPTSDLLEDLARISPFTWKSHDSRYKLLVPGPPSTQQHPSDSILALLARTRSEDVAIPSSVLLQAANHAFSTSFGTVFRRIAEYAIRQCTSDDARPYQDLELFHNLLMMCSQDFDPNADLILPLLYVIAGIPTSEGRPRDEVAMIQSFPFVILNGISRAILRETDLEPFVPLLQTLFRTILKVDEVKKGVEPTNEVIGTWSLYRIILSLVESGYRSLAFELFGDLVIQNRLPSDALNAMTYLTPRGVSVTDEAQDTFDSVVILAFARTCQIFRWSKRMSVLVKAVIARCTEHITPDLRMTLSYHVHDMLAGLVRSETRPDLSGAVSICKACADNDHMLPIPSKVVQDVYFALERERMREEIADLFSAFHRANRRHSDTIVADSLDPDKSTPQSTPLLRFPPPDGQARVGLMSYFTEELRDSDSVRALMLEVVSAGPDASNPLNQNFIASGVALLAESALWREALDMWEKARGTPGYEMLYGNPRAVIRMVKLFLALARRSAGGLDPDAGTKHSADVSRDRRVQDGRMDVAVAEREGVTSVDEVDSTVSEKDGSRMLSKVQYYEVAKSIVADYVRLKSPLKRASHMDLTHIARLSFLIHDSDTAVYALKCVLDRNEMPDMYDLNVLLGGIAQSNPRQASKMAHKALALGVRIDHIAWTMIVHHALLLGDFSLAELIINKSDSETITWDYHSVDMIVRRGFNDKVADRDYATKFFHNSLRLLQRQAREGREAWTSLGIVTVNRALHWRMPVIAFEFWKLLCRPKLASATRLPSGLLPKHIGGKMPLQIRIAEALVFEYEQVGPKCGYTWAMGMAMCVEMDVPTLWTLSWIKNK